MSQNQEVPCKRMNEEESDWVLHVLSQSSYLGMISKMGAALNILPSMFPVTKGMKTEGNIRQLLSGSEILSTYSLKGCKNSPLQLIDTSSLGKIWFAHELNEPWHPGMFFSSCAMLSLMVHFVRRTIRDGSSSVKKTCDLIRRIYHLNDGEGTKYLVMATRTENADFRRVPSVSTQLKYDGTDYHLDHTLNPQIWALQAKHHLVKVGWLNLLLQQHVGGLSPWGLGSVCLVNILGVVVKLQVPWDPGVHSFLGEFVASACGQADSRGEANVMTVATEKPIGQVMTWAGVGPGLELTGVKGENYKGSN
jgi:hypothetical protein